MALTLPAASARLTRNILDSETLIAQALAQVSETVATLSRAQVEVENAPKVECQNALLRLQKSSAKLIEAQAEMLRAHGQLRAIGQAMMGPEEPWCPEDPVFTSGEYLGDSRVA